MKVRTLIERLETHDPEMEVCVLFEAGSGSYPIVDLGIERLYKNDDVGRVSTRIAVLNIYPNIDAAPFEDFQSYDEPSEHLPTDHIAELDRQLANARLGQSIG